MMCQQLTKRYLLIFFSQVEENLEQYRESFDIVIVQDQSMAVVNALMSKILGHS
jgi:hypothetical protein